MGSSREEEIVGVYDKELDDKMIRNEEGIDQEKLEIVKKILEKDIDITLIEEITALTREEVLKR